MIPQLVGFVATFHLLASRLLIRDGSLMVVPRISQVRSENVQDDCWENNHGLAEAVDPESTQELSVLRSPSESLSGRELLSDPNCSSPTPTPRPELSYRSQPALYRSRKRRTIVSSQQVKPFHLGGQRALDKPEQASASSREPTPSLSPVAEREAGDVGESSPCPLERTVIQVDLDLDNPHVPEDNEEAQYRFLRAMEDSINQLRLQSIDAPLVQRLHHDAATEEELMRRSSLVGDIAEVVDNAQRMADVATAKENWSEACVPRRVETESAERERSTEGEQQGERGSASLASSISCASSHSFASAASPVSSGGEETVKRGSMKRSREEDNAGKCTAIKRAGS